MTSIEKKIIQARPSLKKILPVVYWCTMVFAGLNIALGIGAFMWNPVAFPIVAFNYTFLYLWGFLFTSLGFLMLYGLLTKRWERLRGLMCVGLLYKLLWSIALLFRIEQGGIFLFAVPFIGLALLQAVIIIYYLPPDEATDGSDT